MRSILIVRSAAELSRVLDGQVEKKTLRQADHSGNNKSSLPIRGCPWQGAGILWGQNPFCQAPTLGTIIRKSAKLCKFDGQLLPSLQIPLRKIEPIINRLTILRMEMPIPEERNSFLCPNLTTAAKTLSRTHVVK
jgi:hypothetical protein